MIVPLTNIFEYIRHRRRYQQKQLALHLNVSQNSIRNYLVKRVIPEHLVAPWAKFLDIPGPHDGLVQYNERVRLALNLFPFIDNQTDISLITDLIYFGVDMEAVNRVTIKERLNKTKPLPYMVADVLYDLKSGFPDDLIEDSTTMEDHY